LDTNDDDAREEFVIPEDLKIIFICPEIFDRELLLRYKNFQTEGGLGVMRHLPQNASSRNI
jgi:hypothetical protein